MELGKRIVELRKQKGLTQDDTAELFKVTRQTISNWENGKSYPDITLLLAISEKFDVSLDELLKEDRELTENLKKDTKTKNLFKVISLILVILFITIILFLIFKPKGELIEQVAVVYNSIEATKSNNDEIKLYYEENAQKVYFYGLNKIEIIEENKRYDLKEYLSSNEKTIDWFVQLFSEKETYLGTNTKMYNGLIHTGWFSRNFKLSKEEISIIRCNTIADNNDVYIGPLTMKYSSNLCQ